MAATTKPSKQAQQNYETRIRSGSWAKPGKITKAKGYVNPKSKVKTPKVMPKGKPFKKQPGGKFA